MSEEGGQHEEEVDHIWQTGREMMAQTQLNPVLSCGLKDQNEPSEFMHVDRSAVVHKAECSPVHH